MLFYLESNLCVLYAILTVVKCNDDAAVLSVLAQLGTGFVCYSKVRLPIVVMYFFMVAHSID